MKPITKEYIRKFCILILTALFAWMFYSPLLKNYSYIMIVLALLVYFLGPKTKIPSGAAHYSRILVLDIIGFAYWTGSIMLFTFVLGDARGSIAGPVFFFFLFCVFPLYIVWQSIMLASRWFIFTDNAFQWSDTGGIQSVALNDIAAADPYAKKKYPFAPVEMGMVITTKSGRNMRIMSNNLVADEMFMKHLGKLYAAGDKTFARYLKDGGFSEGVKSFNEYLEELQKRMEIS